LLKWEQLLIKKIPERQKIQKVKDRTFHLPLPLQQTFNKLCFDTDPINLNHELILLQNVPTKSKIIWEDVVDIKKVFEALTWLKNNNSYILKLYCPILTINYFWGIWIIWNLKCKKQKMIQEFHLMTNVNH